MHDITMLILVGNVLVGHIPVDGVTMIPIRMSIPMFLVSMLVYMKNIRMTILVSADGNIPVIDILMAIRMGSIHVGRIRVAEVRVCVIPVLNVRVGAVLVRMVIMFAVRITILMPLGAILMV
jgi:hypothetical protein